MATPAQASHAQAAASASKPADASSAVRVVVRIRPLLAHESSVACGSAAAAASSGPCLHVVRTGELPAVVVRDTQTDAFGKETAGETMLSFDAVYDESTTQQQLFEREVLPHVQTRVFAGTTATIAAFGMTGTGKVRQWKRMGEGRCRRLAGWYRVLTRALVLSA
jgi:Kinesin motor domain